MPAKPGKPAATEGDHVLGIDTHIVLIPSPGGPIPTPVPLPFDGVLDADLSDDVRIGNKKAVVVGSKAHNRPAHVPAGGPFQRPPSNEASVSTGSSTIFLNNKPLATLGDTAFTCADPADAPNGTLVTAGLTVIAG